MTRVPVEADFAGLAPDLTVALHFPDPPASTTAIMLLFHGLGDSEAPFASFARAMNLPGVLAIAVRGTGVVPPALVEDIPFSSIGTGSTHFHWGDDLELHGSSSSGIDPDPSFDRALRLVAGRLVQETLVQKCGWRTDDVLLFGFGQGGTFALAMAAKAGSTSSGPGTSLPYKGVVTIGADIPTAVSMASSRLSTPLLVCGAGGGEAVAPDTVELLRQRFTSVQVARWARPRDDDNGMPRNRNEMLPIMQFLASRLRAF